MSFTTAVQIDFMLLSVLLQSVFVHVAIQMSTSVKTPPRGAVNMDVVKTLLAVIAVSATLVL